MQGGQMKRCLRFFAAAAATSSSSSSSSISLSPVKAAFALQRIIRNHAPQMDRCTTMASEGPLFCCFFRAQLHSSSGRIRRSSRGRSLSQRAEGRLKRSPRQKGAASSAKDWKKVKQAPRTAVRGPSKFKDLSSQTKKQPLGKHPRDKVKSSGTTFTADKHQNKHGRATSVNSGPFRRSRLRSSNFASRHQKLKRSQQRKGRSLGFEVEEQACNAEDILSELEVISRKRSKKGKRVMRLDPYDTTSKRFQENDCTQSNEVLDKETDDKPTVSKNAQFRAIRPSPELLLHIERHLLGRRRSSEWHKAGYNVKLAAPLDDDPNGGKDTREPPKEEIFRHKLRFAAAASVSSSFPPADLPEIAFAGTSNVGKSSLINALTRQWGVARTGDKPGLTQTINFFRLGGRLCLVDLPGYGFAYAHDEKKEAWQELVKEYVTQREALRRVCLVVDAKWGLKPRDKEFISLMESARTRYQVVLTKTDMFFPIDLARRATETQQLLEKNTYLISPVMMVSCRNGGGLKLLRASLARVAKGSVF